MISSLLPSNPFQNTDRHDIKLYSAPPSRPTYLSMLRENAEEAENTAVDRLAEILGVAVGHREVGFYRQLFTLARLGILQKWLRCITLPHLLLSRIGELDLKFARLFAICFLVRTLVHFVSRPQLLRHHRLHVVPAFALFFASFLLLSVSINHLHLAEIKQ